MHSGKLNSTQLDWTGSFSSVQFSFPLWIEPATSCDDRPAVAGRRSSSPVFVQRQTLRWLAKSMPRFWRTCDVRQFRRRIVADRCRSSPVQCTAGNWTELNDPVQLSSVQFSFYRASAYWYWYSKSVCPSVRPSVCPLRSGIRWKRLNISTHFFHHTVAHHSAFIIIKQLHEIPTGSPPAGALNTGGV